jgi:hypothetical protein
VDVAQPKAQKTTVQEALGLIPCFAAIVKKIENGFFLDIHISLNSYNGLIQS